MAHALEISFLPPHPPNGILDQYRIRWTLHGKFNYQEKRVPAFQLECSSPKLRGRLCYRVPGLEPEQEYLIQASWNWRKRAKLFCRNCHFYADNIVQNGKTMPKIWVLKINLRPPNFMFQIGIKQEQINLIRLFVCLPIFLSLITFGIIDGCFLYFIQKLDCIECFKNGNKFIITIW